MKLRYILLLPLLMLFTTSCDNEITDFFEFIANRGYEFAEPLGKKNVTVDEDLLGGYMYKSMPVIISKKDKFTYKINFLTTDLHKEDRVVEAHLTKIGTTRFLNLNMGDYYTVVKVNMKYGEDFEMSLLRGGIKENMKEDELKKFLRKSPESTDYVPKPKPEPETRHGIPIVSGPVELDEDGKPVEHRNDLYYSVSFSKVTEAYAREKQKSILYEQKRKLFESCNTYREFNELKVKYPENDLFVLAEKNLYDKCSTIEDYKEFMRNFPRSNYMRDAQLSIAKIREEERMKELIEEDKIAYHVAVAENTIDAYEEFLDNRKTKVYKDSADFRIRSLARSISKEDIEWRWTSGSAASALRYIYYKIDYSDSITDAQWLIEKLCYYSITKGTELDKEKSLKYMGKMVNIPMSPDEYLDLYLNKGFLLWSAGDGDLAYNIFKSRIKSTYVDETTFRAAIKKKYKWYLDENVSFPEQKSTWKKVKKLK